MPPAYFCEIRSLAMDNHLRSIRCACQRDLVWGREHQTSRSTPPPPPPTHNHLRITGVQLETDLRGLRTTKIKAVTLTSVLSTIGIPSKIHTYTSSGSRGGGLWGLTPPEVFSLFFCLSVYENSHGPGP